jgi:N-acetylmuramoyl-L-alanine amidase-like protein
MRVLRAAALVLLALPGVANAGEVTIVARDLSLEGGSRALSASPAPIRFNMAGLHWQGAGSVEFRTRSLAGRWSAWRPAQPEAEDRPNLGSAESAPRRSWRLGNPWWTGPSDRLEVRTEGRVHRVRAWFLSSPVEGGATRALSVASSPAIVSRAGWNADEFIRRAKPRYASSLRFALVHHTAGSNSYSAAQSAAIVRGIEIYHVRANGWNDIGYNFLVDRYGQVFEGRYGGMERNVIGAHAEGFNTGSFGVALIGTYGASRMTAPQRAALVKLLAWRLDVAHVDPAGTLVWRSGGNPKYPAGREVSLRAIAGHRDTGYTACPGASIYGVLAAVAREAAAIGLPKIFEPAVTGILGQPIRFTARLSGPQPWTVRIANAKGVEVASGRGTGARVDWTWSSIGAGLGPFVWRIEADGARAATGSLGGSIPTAPTLSGLVADPAVVLPAAPGASGVTTIGFTLGVPARTTVTVLDSLGTAILTLLDEPRPAGAQTVPWTAGVLPDGRYRVQVTAAPAGLLAVTASTEVVVDRTIAGFSVTPATFSPNGDGSADATSLAFGLVAQAEARIEIVQAGAIVATPLPRQVLAPGTFAVGWDGSNAGVRLPDGAYEAVLTVLAAVGEVAIRAPLTIDTTAPLLRIADGAHWRFWLGEPATVTLVVNGQQSTTVQTRGYFSLPHSVLATSISGFAVDAAGNVSAPVRWP